MSSKSNRLQWMSLLYLVFFVLAVLSPSIYKQGYIGLSETQLEELTIFIFGMAGLISFTFHERFMERHEQERDRAQNDYQKAQAELIESYAYIGSINRKLELLKKLADNQTVAMAGEKRIPKDLFHALAAHACAAVSAPSALIRFVELTRLRTEREFAHQPESQLDFRVSNKDLRTLHESGKAFHLLSSEDGNRVLAVPSDGTHAIKGFLLLPIGDRPLADIDPSLLKVFVNQAEMLYNRFVPLTSPIEEIAV
ncbi:hypothetical protein EXS71_00085 [Candidatus Uhrbacteria bacterium]|nr:hypothetical protein [Candidatus Uhrbacteria bacterium]